MSRHGKTIGHYLRMLVVSLAAIAALVAPAVFVAGALGVKFDLIAWRTGLNFIVTWLPRAGFSALALGVLALVLAVFVRPRGRGLALALFAVLVPAATLFQAAQVRSEAQSVPPIHDITTDRADPPRFSEAVVALRDASGAENTLDYAGKSVNRDGDERQVSELQAEAYPDIQPIVVSAPPAETFEAAMRTAQSMGWTVQYAAPDAGRIDATDTTFWFGFKDDVAIRVRAAQGGGSIVDVRSVSRVGVSDIGTNAARIRDFRDQLTGRLD